jgi:uncharacterized protein
MAMDIQLEDFITPRIMKEEYFNPGSVDIWLNEFEGYRSNGDIHTLAYFTKNNNQILMQARMQGDIIGVCSRCLEDAHIHIDTSFTIIFLPDSQRRHYGEDEEVELTSEELDVEYYRGNKINVDYLFREELILSIPYSPICSEECKGLCPECGGNLNRGECICGEADKAAFNRVKINVF